MGSKKKRIFSFFLAFLLLFTNFMSVTEKAYAQKDTYVENTELITDVETTDEQKINLTTLEKSEKTSDSIAENVSEDTLSTDKESSGAEVTEEINSNNSEETILVNENENNEKDKELETDELEIEEQELEGEILDENSAEEITPKEILIIANNFVFENTNVIALEYDMHKVSFDWSAPADAIINPGDFFKITFDPELYLHPRAGTPGDPNYLGDLIVNGKVIASPTIAASAYKDQSQSTAITYTFNENVQNLENLSGSISFNNSIKKDWSAQGQHTYIYTIGASKIE